MSVINWADSAIADLQSIQSYYRSLDPDLATSILNRIVVAAGMVAGYPGIGSRMRLRRVLKWRAKRTPYLIFSKRSPTRIEIIPVRHDRTDWDSP